MIVNVAVCGKFHFFSYVRYVAEAGVLGRFYFSHKIGAGEALQLPDSHQAVNLPLKAYLTYASQRIFGDAFDPIFMPLFGQIWSAQVASRWQSADIFHFLAHGHSLNLVQHAKADRSVVLAEAVNTHPHHQREILDCEADRWGVSRARKRRDVREQNILTEVANADYVLVPTETVRRSFAKRGIDDHKLVKIPYATNLDRFYPQDTARAISSSNAPLKVICVGSISLRKGQLYLLEACRRLGKSVVDLTLVGYISDDIASLVARYDGEFRHIAQVRNEKLRDVLLEQDLFVLPSLEEGLALSICEALGCGLPVLATKESGGEEVIVEGDNGFFVEPGSVDALAERLTYLHRNRELLAKAGQRAGERAPVEISSKIYADKLVALYRQLAGGQRR